MRCVRIKVWRQRPGAVNGADIARVERRASRANRETRRDADAERAQRPEPRPQRPTLAREFECERVDDLLLFIGVEKRVVLVVQVGVYDVEWSRCASASFSHDVRAGE